MPKKQMKPIKEEAMYDLGYKRGIQDCLDRLPNGHGKLIVSIAYQPDFTLDYDDVKASIRDLLITPIKK